MNQVFVIMKKFIALALMCVFLFASCVGTNITQAPLTSTQTPLPSTVATTIPPSLTATETSIPPSSPSPSPSPTEAWLFQGPGNVTVPILLYHHINISSTNNRYYVSPENFEAQMKLLRDWGYTSITTTKLIEAITEGTNLPQRPFLLTIDDGNLDNYTNAFPITQKYGFTGVLYLVGNYIGTENYLTAEQVIEMYNAGWEVGSHSLNHLDLTKVNTDTIRTEVVTSRKVLEEMLGIPVLTFAYPFGAFSNTAMNFVKTAGYSGAMGASGYAASQGTWNLYYLQRVEIKGNDTLKTFIRFLPWHGDPLFLLADTPPDPTLAVTAAP